MRRNTIDKKTEKTHKSANEIFLDSVRLIFRERAPSLALYGHQADLMVEGYFM